MIEARAVAQAVLLRIVNGRRCAERLCFRPGEIIRILYAPHAPSLSLADPVRSERMAVVATGGYAPD